MDRKQPNTDFQYGQIILPCTVHRILSILHRFLCFVQGFFFAKRPDPKFAHISRNQMVKSLHQDMVAMWNVEASVLGEVEFDWMV